MIIARRGLSPFGTIAYEAQAVPICVTDPCHSLSQPGKPVVHAKVGPALAKNASGTTSVGLGLSILPIPFAAPSQANASHYLVW